jgi:putative nucleotidyltransferase with HDIG domain
MDKTKLPTVPECYKLMKELAELPLNIILHSEKVAKVAVFLARKLKEKGEEIDVELVLVSSLLHDIAKPIDFKNLTVNPDFTVEKPTQEQLAKWKELKDKFPGKKHEEAGSILLSDYPKIAKTIRAHRYHYITEGFNSWEEKLIYYADKTVMHDKIVGVKKRLEDGHKRYVGQAPFPKEVIDIDNKIYDLENEIFNRIGLTPDVIYDLNNICFHNIIKQGDN